MAQFVKPVGIETFGGRLRNARIAKRLTQEQLAEKIGVSKSQVSYYENDKDVPGWDILKQIVLKVDESADYLLTGKVAGGGQMIDPETYALLLRVKDLPEVLQDFVTEACKLAESTKNEIPTSFLKPPTKESWPEFHKYLLKLADQLREREKHREDPTGR